MTKIAPQNRVLIFGETLRRYVETLERELGEIDYAQIVNTVKAISTPAHSGVGYAAPE